MKTFMARSPRVRPTPNVPFAALIVGLLGFSALLMGTTMLRAHEPGEPSGKRVVIIGATSRTANELIPRARWRGHEVIAFARAPLPGQVCRA